MIAAFSTSSPVVSVALIDGGTVIAREAGAARQNASEVCLTALVRMMELHDVGWSDLRGWAADLGPGSFTGTRVAVAIAKTLAHADGLPCYGASAFDLIASDAPAIVPNRRQEWLLRVPGAEPVKVHAVPDGAVGYGIEGDPTYPDAARFAPLLAELPPIEALRFVPEYLVEPSISVPKKAGVLPPEAPIGSA